MAETVSIKVEPGRFCVYHHVKEGTVFYVGHGTPSRPFDAVSRNSVWKEIVGKPPSYEVLVVRFFSNEPDACLFEREEIVRLNPAANFTHSPDLSKRSRKRGKTQIVSNFSVRIDEDLYKWLQMYEQETGFPVSRSVNEGVRTFVEVTGPARLEFFRSQRISGPVPVSGAKKARASSGGKYQNETQAAG